MSKYTRNQWLTMAIIEQEDTLKALTLLLTTSIGCETIGIHEALQQELIAVNERREQVYATLEEYKEELSTIYRTTYFVEYYDDTRGNGLKTFDSSEGRDLWCMGLSDEAHIILYQEVKDK